MDTIKETLITLGVSASVGLLIYLITRTKENEFIWPEGISDINKTKVINFYNRFNGESKNTDPKSRSVVKQLLNSIETGTYRIEGKSIFLKINNKEISLYL